MNRYEYLRLKILNDEELLLNQKGSEGWQLVTVENNIFYFIRIIKGVK
ncbi:MAG: hypothetical protein ACFFDT_37045 [Candidatus Hodarchaeota archaeon]